MNAVEQATTTGTAPAQSNGHVEPEPLLRFSLKRKEYRFEVEDEAGQIAVYKLIEMDGPSRDSYTDMLARHTRVDRAGNPKGSHKGLLAELLVRHVRDSRGNPVPKDIINSWPSSTQIALGKKCNDISGLSNESQDELKND
jgi:hypothetical protein